MRGDFFGTKKNLLLSVEGHYFIYNKLKLNKPLLKVRSTI